MKSVRFALRALSRDLKSGELVIVAAALLIAVAAVSAVGFFTDRVAQGMERQAGEILAADLVTVSRRPLPDGWLDEAAARGLRSAQVWSFNSVIVSDTGSILADVKAVDETYPLRGVVRTAERPFGPPVPEDGIPPRGAAWLDARLLASLDAETGGAVRIGAMEFTATRVLDYTPDQGFGFASLAPTLLMNLADVPATGLIRPGSRVTYRQLYAGDAGAMREFRSWLDARLERGQQIQDVRDSRPEIGNALDRAGRFLGLTALVALLLSAVAVAMAARQYAARHLDAIAVIKCHGGTQAFVLRAYAIQVAIIALSGSVLGVCIGWLAQLGLVGLVAELLNVGELPQASFAPAWTGLATGMVVLAGFALPPLLPLRRVPPARVLRRDLDPPPVSSWLAYGAAILAIGALLLVQTRDAVLAGWFAAGVAATVLLLAAAALVLIRVLNRSRRGVGIAWRYGVANIVRRRGESVAQLVAFGLGIMVLLLLALVRTDLMQGWRQTLPVDAPNHFMINIQTGEIPALRAWFADNLLPEPQLYPMVRGRLTHINEIPAGDIEFASRRAEGFVDREANLSWAERPQVDNRVVAGEWWREEDHGSPLLSVEVELAERLELGLGDRLTYDVAGEPLTFTVHNLRSVDWDSFNPNFFLLSPPGVLEEMPVNWITATWLPPERRGVLLSLLRELPSVTVIDINAILDQVRNVIDQASRAVEYVFLFTLLAGLMVMLAAINASRGDRLLESAMLRTFGASRGVVLRGLAAEFMLLGVLAGVMAAACATATGWLLADRVFDFSYTGSAWVWFAGIVGGGTGIGAAGMLASHGVLNHPPLAVLRQA